jgi:hypothetical protein
VWHFKSTIKGTAVAVLFLYSQIFLLKNLLRKAFEMPHFALSWRKEKTAIAVFSLLSLQRFISRKDK